MNRARKSHPTYTGREHWRASLLRLSDDVFFDYIRTYLGPIKTPYNKQSLIDNLENFLKRSDVRERMLVALSDCDREVLTAIVLSPEASHEGVHCLLGTRIGFVRLHHILLNLEDRLLIYRDPDETGYHLTPMLQDELMGGAVDRSLLFPSKQLRTPAPETAIWCDDLILLALFAQLRSEGRVLRGDGKLRKVTAKTLPTFFPTHARASGFEDKLCLLLQALVRSGLCEEQDGQIRPSLSAFQKVGELSPQARACLLPIAHAAVTDEDSDTHAALPSSLLLACVEVLLSLNTEEGYPAASLHGMFALAIQTATGRESPAKRPTHEAFTQLPERVVESLVAMGILCEFDNELLRLNGRFARLAEEGLLEAERPALTLQSTFELRITPRAPYLAALTITAASELVSADSTLGLELTRRGLGNALADGITPEHLIETLESLGKAAVPQNVGFSIRNWADEFHGAQIHEGVVLTADEDRRDLVEHDPRVAVFIQKKLAPGVYLLRKSEESEWRQALAASGVFLLPAATHDQNTHRERELDLFSAVEEGAENGLGVDRSSAPAQDTDTQVEESHSTQRSDGRPGHYSASNATESGDSESDNSERMYDELKQTLLTHLHEQSFPSDIEAELRDRIENRVILDPKQLRADSLRRDQTEAKGMDYAGKVRMAEQALSSKRELLEIIERNGAGSPTRRLLKPTVLKRSGNQLHLHGVELPSEQEIRIDIAKIGLLRRVRGAVAST